MEAYLLWIKWLVEAERHGLTIDPAVLDDFREGMDLVIEGIDPIQWIYEQNHMTNGLFFDPWDSAITPTVIDGEAWFNDSQEWGPVRDNQVTLLINYEATDEDIRTGVLAYVKLYREMASTPDVKSKGGRTKFEPVPAKYKLVARPEVAALQLTLTVWLALKDQSRNQWEIGEDLLSKGYDIVSNVRSLNLQLPLERQRLLSNRISRIKKRAITLMEGVAVGIFPKTEQKG